MNVYTIDATDDPGDIPLEFIDRILKNHGGTINIEPNAPPQKVLWTLKSLLRSIGIGFQWATINQLTNNGMHGEHAEHHVTKMINELCGVEVPPLPTQDEIAEIKARLGVKEEEQEDSTE